MADNCGEYCSEPPKFPLCPPPDPWNVLSVEERNSWSTEFQLCQAEDLVSESASVANVSLKNSLDDSHNNGSSSLDQRVIIAGVVSSFFVLVGLLTAAVVYYSYRQKRTGKPPGFSNCSTKSTNQHQATTDPGWLFYSTQARQTVLPASSLSTATTGNVQFARKKPPSLDLPPIPLEHSTIDTHIYDEYDTISLTYFGGNEQNTAIRDYCHVLPAK